jgi:tetraacyldisaccharide 4'-kinase
VSILSRVLTPLSLLFGAVVFIRRAFYRLHLLRVVRIGIPVVVVGNINTGGSGKTPLVLWIAKHLAATGWRPGIVSRGYGGRVSKRGEPPVEVTIASDPAAVGDEPLLLARRSGCPVWIGADRAAACRALRDRHPECTVLLLDDGLQHYRVERDIEIAVVDARGFGNGHLFPAGPLREPVSRLADVDAVVCNGTAPAKGFAMRLEGKWFVGLIDASRKVEAGGLGSSRVHAVAGIGDPQRYFTHLEGLGLEVIPHPFPDHHAFAASDLEFGDGLPVVMTEKDAVKCKLLVAAAAGQRFWMLPVSAELDPAFGVMLEGKLRGKLRGSKAA